MGLAEQLQQAVIKAYGPTPWPIPAFNVMAKPGGPSCNMACEYCFYRHKSQTQHLDGVGTISDALLERFIAVNRGTRYQFPSSFWGAYPGSFYLPTASPHWPVRAFDRSLITQSSYYWLRVVGAGWVAERTLLNLSMLGHSDS